VSITVPRRPRPFGRRLLFGGLILGAAGAAAACSSTPSSGSPAASTSSAAPSASSSASGTVSTANIAGLGTVLVNQHGQTLYMLTSDKQSKITCTVASGCTKAWPLTLLPTGTTAPTAGSGAKSSLLGTLKDASGNLEVTYNHWPLYTFSGDSGTGQAKGQGLVAFGGTWYVLNASGTPVTTKVTSGSSSSSGGGVGGY
jgi:predicted lipoprotein with Yx(FWY)xxD motif